MPEDSTQLLIPMCLMCMHVCFSRVSRGGFFFFFASVTHHIYSLPPGWKDNGGGSVYMYVWIRLLTGDCHSEKTFLMEVAMGGGLSKVIICQWAHKEPPFFPALCSISTFLSIRLHEYKYFPVVKPWNEARFCRFGQFLKTFEGRGKKMSCSIQKWSKTDYLQLEDPFL